MSEMELDEEDRPHEYTVDSPEQLGKLLAFQQDPAAATNDLKSARAFLDKCLDSSSAPGRTAKAANILSAYLDRQFTAYQRKSKNESEKSTFLPELFQTWNLAATNSNDRLLALATRVLRLVLRCISHSFELSRFGAPLCRTILQYGNLKTVSRGVSSVKLSISSPCLQLMTELVTFDGGAFARQVFLKREWTFDSSALSRKLGFANRRGENEKVRESIRADAIRYVLANLKFQPPHTQVEILKLGNVVRPMFDHLISDSHEVAIEVLDTIRESVLKNKGIPRSSKSFMLTDRVLSNVAKLYRIEDAENEEVNERSLQHVAHQFLLLACTSAQNGTLYNSWGWYYRKMDEDELDEREDQAHIPQLESSTTSAVPAQGIHPRNTKLASFLQTLRPWASNLEQDLILAIFQSCPELIADFFLKKASFQFDPKLTATWIGYASFVYSSILLPVPKYFGRSGSYDSSPPQSSVILENLLPSALTQAVLTRCLNQSVEMITFFAVRILIISLEKLETVLKTFEDAMFVRNKSKWEEAGRTLIYEFCQRCPKMKDVTATFFRSKSDRPVEREAITRLLSLYYRVIPLVALEENFDVSKPLSELLKGEQAKGAGEKELRMLELGHLLNCARWSTSMNWFKKGEAAELSPFTCLLMIVAQTSSKQRGSNSVAQISSIVASVAQDNYFLEANAKVRSCDALILSLSLSPGQGFLEFLDDCIGRHIKRPVKYWDDMEDLKLKDKKLASAQGPFSNIWMTIREQSSFLREPEDILIERAVWIAHFSLCCKAAGEDPTLIDAVMKHISASANESMRKAIKKTLSARSRNDSDAEKLIQVLSAKKPSELIEVPETPLPTSTETPSHTYRVDFTFPPPYDTNHPSLARAQHKDIESLLADADLTALVLYLSSPDLHIRLQALALLTHHTSTLPASSYPERTPLALLLGELLETASPTLRTAPLPFAASQFAAHAVHVLMDPTHFMYPKINTFLNREPAWHVPRLPSHWLRSAVLELPADDDAHHREVHWVLDYLVDALGSAQDLNMCFRKGVFERVCALYGASTSSAALKAKVLRLLWRATSVEGGSDLLITRYAVVGWVRGLRSLKDGFEGALRDLEERILGTCDRERIERWSHGTVVIRPEGDGDEMDVD